MKKALIGFVVLLGFGVILFNVYDQSSESKTETAEPSSPVNAESSPQAEAAASSTTTQRSPSAILNAEAQVKSQQEKIEAILKKYNAPSGWQIQKTENGSVFSFTGGKISELAKDSSRVDQFAADIFEATTGKSGEMDLAQEQIPATPHNASRTYQQAYQGFEVLNGYLRVFNNNNGDVYSVSQQLKILGDVDTLIAVDSQQALEFARKKYASRSNLSVSLAEEKPLVVNLNPGESYLVWQVHVFVTAPLIENRSVLVSTVDGRIVKDTNILKR